MRGLAPKQTPAGVLKKLTGRLHYHACTGCRLSYSCSSCKDAALNGRCQTCREVRRPNWEAARDPRPCCYVHGNARLVLRADELERYQLAGPGPWFQCRLCARAHGEYPTKKED